MYEQQDQLSSSSGWLAHIALVNSLGVKGLSILRGRNDLLDIKNLGVNALRSYEYKGYYNHTPFLNYAQSLGLKVLFISVHKLQQ